MSNKKEGKIESIHGPVGVTDFLNLDSDVELNEIIAGNKEDDKKRLKWV